MSPEWQDRLRGLPDVSLVGWAVVLLVILMLGTVEALYQSHQTIAVSAPDRNDALIGALIQQRKWAVEYMFNDKCFGGELRKREGKWISAVVNVLEQHSASPLDISSFRDMPFAMSAFDLDVTGEQTRKRIQARLDKLDAIIKSAGG
jgi:hypothetical protein